MTKPYEYINLTKQLRASPVQPLGFQAADAIDSFRSQLALAKRERDALVADHEAATKQISELHAICDGYYRREGEASAKIDNLQADVSRLVAFKEYVHGRLDAAGIDGAHSKAGCRIGDRLDLALAYVPPVPPKPAACPPPVGHVAHARGLVAQWQYDAPSPAADAIVQAILSLCDALDAR